MKKMILLALAFVMFSTSFAFAEATFDQIQDLIKQQNYSAAVAGLEIIIKNHPKSAKAFYAMSQAQAGLGNQVKAKEALDIATGIDPTLKFASSGNVEKLKEAITPQTKKIEAIENHTTRNVLIAIVLLGGIGAFFYFRKKKEDEPVTLNEYKPNTKNAYEPPAESFYTNDSPMHTSASQMARVGTVRDESAKPYVPAPKKSVEPLNPPLISERKVVRSTTYPRTYNQPSTPAPVSHTTVVNNSGNDMLTGVLVGSMLSNSHHDHNIHQHVGREVETYNKREPVEERSSSWDAPKVEERSSSWDAPKVEERSSSWDAPEERSSSWSSSSESSSSSWSDSSSSSSSSDSGSSSSWD